MLLCKHFTYHGDSVHLFDSCVGHTTDCVEMARLTEYLHKTYHDYFNDWTPFTMSHYQCQGVKEHPRMS